MLLMVPWSRRSPCRCSPAAAELVGAVAPLTISPVLGAFLFGAAMWPPTAAARHALIRPAAARRRPSWCCHLRLRQLPRHLPPAHLIELGGCPRWTCSPSAGRPRSALTRSRLAAWWPGWPGARTQRLVATHRPSPSRPSPSGSYAPEASFVAAAEARAVALGDALVAGGRCWRCSTRPSGRPANLGHRVRHGRVGREGGLRARLGPLGRRLLGCGAACAAPGRAYPRRRHLGDQHRPDLRRDRRLALERRAEVLRALRAPPRRRRGGPGW